MQNAHNTLSHTCLGAQSTASDKLYYPIAQTDQTHISLFTGNYLTTQFQIDLGGKEHSPEPPCYSLCPPPPPVCPLRFPASLHLSICSFLLTPGIMIRFPSAGIIEYGGAWGESATALWNSSEESSFTVVTSRVCVCVCVCKMHSDPDVQTCCVFLFHFHKLHTETETHFGLC